MTALALVLALCATGARADDALPAADEYHMHCATCHGAERRGDGIAGRVLNPMPANLAAAAIWSEKTDAQLVAVVLEGGAAHGLSPMMPAWGGTLSDDQASAIVAWLREQAVPTPAPAVATDP